jgi:radical SAM protein (TIGR01212 family)
MAISLPDSPSWRQAGYRYYPYNYQLRQRYGRRVQRVSIDAGFTCPNVDGTVTVGGCVFCDNRSFSPSRRVPQQDILNQIDVGIRNLKRRYKCDDFIAYFQPATNTYAPVDRLRPLYERALTHPKIIAMAIGTRPDCVPDDVLDLLEEIAGKTDLTVEYGMQTIHDRSLDWMNRGHHHDAFVDAMDRSRGRGFEICAHVILGIPGESREDMLATARELALIGVDAVKIHNLYAVKRTPMGEQVERGELELMSLSDYIATLVEFLEQLAPNIVIERVSGEAPRDFFIGPEWALDKSAIRKRLDEELGKRDSWQGKCFLGR